MYSIVCIVQDMYRERKKKEREFNHHLPRGGKDDLATIAGTVRTAAGAKWLLPQERYVYVARRERIGGDDESWILRNLCCLSFFFVCSGFAVAGGRTWTKRARRPEPTWRASIRSVLLLVEMSLVMLRHGVLEVHLPLLLTKLEIGTESTGRESV